MGVCHAFTFKYNGQADRIITRATVVYGGSELEVLALWDTGATRSVIAHEVAMQMGLASEGKVEIATPSGAAIVDTFLAGIKLPNGVSFDNVLVADSKIGAQNIGLLIGMDIIGLGDFSITHGNGDTTFSFRYPSSAVVDYSKQLRVRQVMGPDHGPGNKKSNHKKHRKK